MTRQKRTQPLGPSVLSCTSVLPRPGFRPFRMQFPPAGIVTGRTRHCPARPVSAALYRRCGDLPGQPTGISPDPAYRGFAQAGQPFSISAPGEAQSRRRGGASRTSGGTAPSPGSAISLPPRKASAPDRRCLRARDRRRVYRRAASWKRPHIAPMDPMAIAMTPLVNIAESTFTMPAPMLGNGTVKITSRPKHP